MIPDTAEKRREYEQLAGDERIAALLRQFVGDVEQAHQVIAGLHVAGLAGHLRQLVQRFGQALAQHRHVDARLRQQRPGAAALLVQQRQQQVRGFDDGVVAADGERLGIAQRLLETRGEFVHAHGKSRGSRPSRGQCLLDAVADRGFKTRGPQLAAGNDTDAAGRSTAASSSVSARGTRLRGT